MNKARELYLDVFKKHFSNVKTIIPLCSKTACAIVEPRSHEHLEFVIKNMVFFCPGWSLYIFHSKENRTFVHDLLCDHQSKYIHFIEFCDGNISVQQYNKLLVSPWFYNNFANDGVEYVLIFQTDSFLCRHGIDEYVRLGFDYIGAPWDHENYEFQAGNGGLSLRKVSKMIEITTSPAYQWQGENEDLFFQKSLEGANGRLMHKNTSLMRSFSVEGIFHPNPLGVHKYWCWLPNRFLDIHLHQVGVVDVEEAWYGTPRYLFVDVTSVVQFMATVEKTIWASNDWLGDPCPSHKKVLRVTYRVNNSKERHYKEIDEDNYYFITFTHNL